MKVKITQRFGDKNNLYIYKKAVEYFLINLLSDKNLNRLNIEIKMKSFPANYWGGAFVYPISRRAKKSFIMEVDRNVSFPLTIKYLAHECVHVKQTVEGYSSESTYQYKWYDKIYPAQEMYAKFKTSDDSYSKSPWEVEAKRREQMLAQSFLSQLILNPEMFHENERSEVAWNTLL